MALGRTINKFILGVVIAGPAVDPSAVASFCPRSAGPVAPSNDNINEIVSRPDARAAVIGKTQVINGITLVCDNIAVLVFLQRIGNGSGRAIPAVATVNDFVADRVGIVGVAPTAIYAT